MGKKNKEKFLALVAISMVGFCNSTFAADAVVTTDRNWLSGATHIFGRMSVSGIANSNVKEQGLCYSSRNSKPTIDDNTCVTYLSNNGKIYILSGLEPATVYNIRSYVKLKTGEVIYGEPVKAITRPRGSVSYTIRDGFPTDALTRIQSAAKEAVELWNEYTGIQGLNVNIGYGAQTPTADCSYGGWMRVGPNASYQRTGTLLHEMLHAIGVGTIATWYGPDSFLREAGASGYWLGVRATRALRFWDNSPTSRLNGDGTHMWPYGVNGAHEDTGTQLLYIGNSVLAEALGEDGLAPTSEQFATPAYVFEQSDTIKYYLKNEEYGLSSKFLRVDKNGNLQWIGMDADKATSNDSAAWNITFDPSTCYYVVRNVATGNYLSYSSTGINGIKTKAIKDITDKERFHLLPSPIEVAHVNGETKTGYWIGYVNNNTMNCLTAQNSNLVKSNVLDFSKDGGAQRWLIMTDTETKELTQRLREQAAQEVLTLLGKMEPLLSVPHKEVDANADADFLASLSSIRMKVATAQVDELKELKEEANASLRLFLEGVQATNPEEPFDISFLIQNAGMDATTGWSVSPSLNNSCGEFYQKSFDMNQKLTKMPAGVYVLKMQGFQRPGTTVNVYNDYLQGTDKTNAYIYVVNTNNKQTICNIMDDAQDKKKGVGSETAAGALFVPNDMLAASEYFAAGLYENFVKATMKYRATMTIGLKADNNAQSSYWTIFDNFRLYYYGEETPVTGISEVIEETPGCKQGIYTIGGQLVGKNLDNLQGLPSGIYIVKGKKVLVKGN